MLPGFVAFCIAGTGAVLGFVASAMSLRWLGILAIALTALGVLGGFVFILRGWWRLFRGEVHHTKDTNAR